MMMLWDELLYSELRFVKFARILFFLSLVGGVIWSGYFAYWNWKLTQESISAGEIDPSSIQVDQGKVTSLQALIYNVDGFLEQRKNAEQLVMMSEVMRREPFRSIDITKEVSTLPAPAKEEIKPVEIIVPTMELKAIINIQGQKPYAIVSMQGQDGIVLSSGEKFDSGKGRVMSISPDKVVITWMGQKVILEMPR